MWLAGCGGPGGDGPPDLHVPADLSLPPLCSDDSTDGGPPANFETMQTIFDNNCVGCHCCSNQLDLSRGVSYGHLMSKLPTPDEACGGVFVKPGNPAASYLYQKLSNPHPCFGQQMPLGEFDPIPRPLCEVELVRRWIAAGASPN